MTTTVPERDALELDTLNRMYYLDVNTGTKADPLWVGVFGIQEFNAPTDATSQDTSDFDSGGHRNNTVTARSWSVTCTVRRATQEETPTAYDPGQEFLRAKADKMGGANKCEIRWYEMTEGGPRVESYRGRVSVAWAPNGGGMDAVNTVGITLQGAGRRESVTHPAPAAP